MLHYKDFCLSSQWLITSVYSCTLCTSSCWLFGGTSPGTTPRPVPTPTWKTRCKENKKSRRFWWRYGRSSRAVSSFTGEIPPLPKLQGPKPKKYPFFKYILQYFQVDTIHLECGTGRNSWRQGVREMCSWFAGHFIAVKAFHTSHT